MDKQISPNSLAVVGVVFGAILLGMLLSEVAQPVGKQAEVGTAAPALKRTKTPAPQGPPIASGDQEAALKAWEAFVSRVKKACERYNSDPAHKSGGTSNFVRFEGEDVRKSESLRYLFEGELIVYEVFHFKTVYVDDVRWRFGWRGGRWEYKDSTTQKINTPGGPTDPAQLDAQPRPVPEKLLEGEKKKLILDCLN